MSIVRPTRLICVSIFLLALIFSNGRAAQYSIKDLGDIGGGNSAGNALNNRGEVVGQSQNLYGQVHAFLYSRGHINEEAVLGGGYSWAYGINDRGHFVGQALVGSGYNRFEHAFLDFSDLGAALGATNSAAEDINDSGDVVGYADSGAYLYSKGKLRYLDAGNDNGSGAYGINRRRDIVGEIETPDGNSHAFIYTFADSQLTDLQTLGGPSSSASDINDSQVVVGFSDLDNVGNAAPFVWENGTMMPLPTLGGHGGNADAINNRGDIVGFATGSNNVGRAVIWDSTGAVSDLNNLIPPGSGWVLQFARDINNFGQITGQGLINGRGHAFLMTPPLRVQLVDAHKTPLKNDTIKVAKVSNDPPNYTEHRIGTFVTDSHGWLEIPQDSVTLDDSLKFELRVRTEPAVKHTGVLGTMYTITLDNVQFDSLGNIAVPALADDAVQVVMDHTTIAWDLVVSIEWDASEAYLTSTETGFEKASNYLYDVSDGQMRFDTIVILDSAANWSDADLRVHASNIQWPQATPAGIKNSSVDAHLFLPRAWYGDSTPARNNSTHAGFETDLEKSRDFRTRVHEFGHYALGFYDEYRIWNGTSYVSNVGHCSSVKNYGFMDRQYYDVRPGYFEFATEMSTATQYAAGGCQNNEQFRVRGMSCWDYLQSQFQGPYMDGNTFVPVMRPSDRPSLPAGKTYVKGPNDVDTIATTITCDVGAHVVFPSVIRAPNAREKTLTLTDSAGNVLPKLSTFLLNRTSHRRLVQGISSDSGQIRLLGVIDHDTVVETGGQYWIPSAMRMSASLAPTKKWMSAAFAAFDADSQTIQVTPIQGDFPMNCLVSFAGGSLIYRLRSEKSFSQRPQLELQDNSNSYATSEFQEEAGGYSSTFSGDVPHSGSFTISAVDDSSKQFFVPTEYTIASRDSASLGSVVWGPNGASSFMIDLAIGVPSQVIIVASSYPVLRNGLPSTALQAGDAISLAVSNSDQLTGDNQINLRYDDSDLAGGGAGLDSTLQMFHWNDVGGQWELIGGTVDAVRNEISAPITQTGLYAAFTTAVPTGINDQPYDSPLPKGFELGQNYPNPFNPVTTISYTLPKRILVTIEVFNVLGQKVRTLINETKSAGRYSVVWDGEDSRGVSVSSGIYLYRLIAGDLTETKKMMLLK